MVFSDSATFENEELLPLSTSSPQYEKAKHKMDRHSVLCISPNSLVVVVSIKSHSPQEKTTFLESYFIPHGGCTDFIIRKKEKFRGQAWDIAIWCHS